uniref:Uncharacterized protein n=1 Tax=Caenorhabditis japonica TaxID=281687 RepID=A0A8R1EWT1_CAEJA
MLKIYNTIVNLSNKVPQFQIQAQNTSEITGDRCDRLELFGLHGKATCGYIAWFDDDGHIVNSWYKTR